MRTTLFALALLLVIVGILLIDPKINEPVRVPEHEYRPAPRVPAVSEYVPTFNAYDVSAEGFSDYGEWMAARPNNKMGIADPIDEEYHEAIRELRTVETPFDIIQAPNRTPRYYNVPHWVRQMGGEYRVSSVPEPETWVLMFTGLVLCIVMRYRRHK